MTTSLPSDAAREQARNKTNGQFGEQRLADPGDTLLTSKDGSNTVIETLRVRLLPSLGEPGIDVEQLGVWLREHDMIRTDANGVHLPNDLLDNPQFQTEVQRLTEEAAVFRETFETCPACGDPDDYCPGHGELGDPAGYRILAAHDAGDHRMCVADCHQDPQW